MTGIFLPFLYIVQLTILSIIFTMFRENCPVHSDSSIVYTEWDSNSQLCSRVKGHTVQEPNGFTNCTTDPHIFI